MIVLKQHFIVYDVLLLVQLIFYVAALLRGCFPQRNIRFLNIPFYFTFMNIALYQGFFKYLKGNHTVLWNKAARK
jgi:hypothetical protein